MTDIFIRNSYTRKGDGWGNGRDFAALTRYSFPSHNGGGGYGYGYGHRYGNSYSTGDGDTYDGDGDGGSKGWIPV